MLVIVSTGAATVPQPFQKGSVVNADFGKRWLDYPSIWLMDVLKADVLLVGAGGMGALFGLFCRQEAKR